MKLRFEVDQADSFRRGIDRPKSIVSIDVNPADVPEESRALIAEHLEGIDVLQLFYHNGEVLRGHPIRELLYTKREPRRIVAKAANLDALIHAIRANDDYISRIQKSFSEPVQLRLIERPPKNEGEFQFISDQRAEGLREIIESVAQMKRIWFECLICPYRSLNRLGRFVFAARMFRGFGHIAGVELWSPERTSRRLYTPPHKGSAGCGLEGPSHCPCAGSGHCHPGANRCVFSQSQAEDRRTARRGVSPVPTVTR